MIEAVRMLPEIRWLEDASLTSQRHDQRSASSCDHGVLVLNGRRLGAAIERPRIIAILCPFGAQGQERLDGEHQAFAHDAAFGAVGPSCNLRRLLVERQADAVTGKVPDQAVPVLPGKGPDRLTDTGNWFAGTNLLQACPHRPPA